MLVVAFIYILYIHIHRERGRYKYVYIHTTYIHTYIHIHIPACTYVRPYMHDRTFGTHTHMLSAVVLMASASRPRSGSEGLEGLLQNPKP